ncbi:MAG: ThiF family adenylyltransferase [Dehalococcoidia bacterium]|nr:MAG: ThiF family adenylyltransferase [Dehalococcoidia bacterium]
MSQSLISRSPDLTRLRDEGYELEIRGGFLLVKHVPYVTATRQVRYGVLVSELTLAGDVTTTPNDHIVMFAGEVPCDSAGTPLSKIIADSERRELAGGVVVNHRFSSKPPSGYPDFFEKMSTYANILTSQAQAVDPEATALTFAVIEDEDETSVFRYVDTASTRAGITRANERFAGMRVAIVGLGGTGSYILDLVAKTPVSEIHLFDGDVFGQHNAFRSPGAPSVETLRERSTKADYFAVLYSNMRRNVVPHGYLDAATIDELRGMDFVFIAIDSGSGRKRAVEQLTDLAIAFIDVGMGVYEVDGAFAGLLRVTTSTAQSRELVAPRLPYSDGDGNDDYSRNIQIADLNALNASLAVIKWKKLIGFYVDLEREHSSVYQIDGNAIINEDATCEHG